MANGFDRFSRGARQSLSMAQEEARRLNHRYIGTEHLLRDSCGRKRRGCLNLSEMGLSIGQLRDAVSNGRHGRSCSASLQLGEQTRRLFSSPSTSQAARSRADRHRAPAYGAGAPARLYGSRRA